MQKDIRISGCPLIMSADAFFEYTVVVIFVKHYRTRCRRKKLKVIVRLIVLFVCFVLLVAVILDYQQRPLIKSVAQDRAITVCSLIISETVSRVLSEIDLGYRDMVDIQTDTQGQVTYVNTNVLAINIIKFTLTNQIQQALNECQRQLICIPLGTLTGNEFLLGRGPRITIQLDISNRIQMQILSEFTEAGINQTQHRIFLEITTSVSALIPWYTTSAQVVTDFLLAESIIVGKIPEAYTIVVTDPEDIADDINNYSAEKR